MRNIQMHKLFLVLLIILTTFISISFAKDVEIPEKIKIGIYYTSSSKSSIELEAPYGMYVGTIDDNGYFDMLYNIDAKEKITVSKGSTKYSVSVSGHDEIGDEENYPYFLSKEKNGETYIKINDKTYRGNVEIRRLSDSDMTIINDINLDEYLYGVVPKEIGASSHEEALKAQAIVARTFAVKNLGKRSKLGFDLFDGVSDQAYGGYEWENSRSNKAVDDTSGMIVVYKNQPITASYFSTSGGYTEDSKNVWGGEVAYLKSVRDEYEPIVGNTTWEVTYTADQIKEKLISHDIDVGEILELIPTKHTFAGRVSELKVVGTEGTETITNSRTREYFDLKSQWYTINSEAPNIDYLGIQSEGYDEQYDEEDIKNSKESDTNNNDNKSDDKEKEDSLKDDDESENNNSKSEEKITTKGETKVESKEENVEKDDLNIIIKKESGDELTTGIFKDSSESLLVNVIESGENIVIDNSKTIDKVKILSDLKTACITFIEQVFSIKFKDDSQNMTKLVFEPLKASNSKSVGEFTFRGRGWGHAVGMSQNGAKGMANNGFTAEEIIKWYYTGVDITTK